jgi:hypothetical protein
MKKTICFLTVGLSVVSLVGCAAEAPQQVVVPVVASVNVVDATLSNPVVSLPNCHLQGQVLVRTVDRFKPNDLVVTEEEMSELKDKTMRLNANSVVIRQNQLLHHKGMYVHAIDADAYSCNPSMY